jgi:diguanylate cyclase (GGDEF)-like protein/PAS domain S-box-containing protein
MPDASLMVASNNRIVCLNGLAERLFGYASEELEGEHLDVLIPSRHRSTHAKHVERYAEGPQTRGMGSGLSLSGVRKDGSEIPLDISLTPLETEEGVRILAAIRDISQSEERYRAVFEQVAVGIVHGGIDSPFLNVNPKFCEMLRYTRTELLALGLNALVHPEEQERVVEGRERLLRGAIPVIENVVRMIRKDGGIIWAHMTTSLVRGSDGRPLHFMSVLHDVTGQKLAEERIRRLNRVYAVLSGINALIVRADDRVRLLREACRIAVQAGGFSVAWTGLFDPATNALQPVAWEGVGEEYIAAVTETLRDVDGSEFLARALREKRPAIATDVEHDPTLTMRREIFALGTRVVVALPLIVGDQAVGVLALHARDKGFLDEEEMRLLLELAGDIAFALDHIEKADRVRYLALHDSLTELPNRTLLCERLEQSMGATDRYGRRLAVFAFDLERFRTINETLGRQAGDELLSQIATRARGHLPEEASLARIGPDQFAMIVPAVSTSDAVVRAIEDRMQQILGSPFLLSGTEVRVSARMGIAVYPDDGKDAEGLLRNAEAALRKAKTTTERFVFFAPEMTAHAAERLALDTQLRAALENEDFVLRYQVKKDLESGRISGVEGLIRWQSRELGEVPAGKFIPLMEETGLILPAGMWALSRAIADHARWLEMELSAPRVAVNISALHLRRRGFVAGLREALARGADPAGIDLEITESILMDNIEENMESLKSIRSLGVEIAIDDFGTGYSSLGYLARLPATALKIDRAFIASMLDDPNAMTLVQTVISLAHSLRLKVIAEGVEIEEQAKVLRLLRCDEIQGWLIGYPLSFEEMTRLLQREEPDGANSEFRSK